MSEILKIDGKDWVRVAGLVVPAFMPTESGVGALPEARVTISMKIEGGGLQKDEVVTVDISPLVLTKLNHLTFDVLQEEEERIFYYDDTAIPRMPEQRVRLNVALAPVSLDSGVIYTITLPTGETVQG